MRKPDTAEAKMSPALVVGITVLLLGAAGVIGTGILIFVRLARLYW